MKPQNCLLGVISLSVLLILYPLLGATRYLYQPLEHRALASSLSEIDKTITTAKPDTQTVAQTFSGSDKAQALSNIAFWLAEARQFNKAVEVAQTIEDSQMKAEALINVGFFLAKAGRVSEALKVIENGWEIELALTLAKAEELELALQVVRTVENYYGSSIKAYILAELGQFDQALQVANTIDAGNNPNFNEAFFWGSLAIKLAEAGQFDRALKIVQSLQDDFAKTEAFGHISVSLVAAGQVDQAVALVNTVQNPGKKASILYDIVSKLAELGNYDKAIEITQSMEDNLHKNNAWGSIALNLSISGQLSEALQIINRIDDEAIKALKLEGIASVFAQDGKYNPQDLEIFSQLIPTLEPEDGQGISLVNLVVKLAESGQYEPQALQVIEQTLQTMKEDNRKAWVLSNIASALAKAGFFLEAERIVQTIPGDTTADYKAEALREIALEYAANGKASIAEKLLSQALQLTNTMEDNLSKVWRLSDLAVEYAKVGRPSQSKPILIQALEIARTLTDNKDRALHEIVNGIIGLARVGQFDQALELMNRLESDVLKVRALGWVAEEYTAVGQVDKATELLLKSLAIVESN